MGDGVSFECPNCHENFMFILGVTFNDNPAMVFYENMNSKPLLESLVPHDIFTETMKKIADGWVLDDDAKYGWDISYCPTCGLLENKFYYTLKKGEKTFIPQYHCRLCDTHLETYPKDDYDCLNVLRDGMRFTDPVYYAVCPACGRILALTLGRLHPVLRVD